MKVINNSFCILEQPKKIFEHAWKELGLDDEENLKACQERIALAEHCQIEENQRLFFNEFGWWIGGPVNAKLERDP